MEISAAEYRKMIDYKLTKYRNKKIEFDGLIFDSKKEAERYQELKLLELFGQIRNLKTQEKFLILDKIPGVQRASYYIADFVYQSKTETGWENIIEDVKSKATKTQVYQLKKKIMRFRGYIIREVI